MIDLSKNEIIVGASYHIVTQDNCTITQIRNSSGEGVMTNYELFDGVYLMYNDFHMETCESALKVVDNIFCIDHCREGRLEHQIKDGLYVYSGAGDLKIDNRKYHKGNIVLPLKHYHGITICIDINKAKTSLVKQFPNFNIDLIKLQKKFCNNDEPFIISHIEAIEHIFHELYSIPEKIKQSYMILKVYELLLFLDALEIPKNKDEHLYFYKTQVEKIKAIHKLMIENLDKHYTLEELSQKYQISLTVMKKCFKNVYGDSVFSYMKTYKMNQAAVLLKTKRELNISDIAGIVGYDSPGKFSTAFKSIIGMTPSAYRNHFVYLDKNGRIGEEINIRND